MSSVVQFAIGDDDLATPINARVQPHQIFTATNNQSHLNMSTGSPHGVGVVGTGVVGVGGGTGGSVVGVGATANNGASGASNSMMSIADVEAQLQSNLHLGPTSHPMMHHQQHHHGGSLDIFAHHQHLQQQQQQQQQQSVGAFSPNPYAHTQVHHHLHQQQNPAMFIGQQGMMSGMHQHLLQHQQQQQQQQHMLFNQSGLNDLMIHQLSTPQKQQQVISSPQSSSTPTQSTVLVGAPLSSPSLLSSPQQQQQQQQQSSPFVHHHSHHSHHQHHPHAVQQSTSQQFMDDLALLTATTLNQQSLSQQIDTAALSGDNNMIKMGSSSSSASSPSPSTTTTSATSTATTTPTSTTSHKRTGSGYYLNVIYNTYNSKTPDATYNHIHRRLFPDTKLMSPEEIEAIVRQQMQDLQIKNPFLDDFYYFSLINKHGIESKAVNASAAHYIQEALELYSGRTGKTEEELKREETLAHQPRVFGRIPSQNVRAPRAMFEIDETLKELQNSPTSLSTLRRDPYAQLNLLIENGLVYLIHIQESALCMSNLSNEMSPQEIQKYFGLCQTVARMLNVPTQQVPGYFSFSQILEKRKGIKFVSKALRHLPEPFIVHLLKSVLLFWGFIFVNFMAKHEDADELKQCFIRDTIAGINALSLVAICQILHDDPTREDIIRINYVEFFAHGGTRVLAAMLKRAHDMIPTDPSTISAWRSDFAQLFHHLRSYGFTRIASVHEDGWKLLEHVLVHCDDHQSRAMTEDLQPLLAAPQQQQQATSHNTTGFLQQLKQRTM